MAKSSTGWSMSATNNTALDYKLIVLRVLDAKRNFVVLVIQLTDDVGTALQRSAKLRRRRRKVGWEGAIDGPFNDCRDVSL